MGPGEYALGGGVGEQVDSRKPSAPRGTMKGVGREVAPIGSKMSHDRGPGPQEYVLPTTITVSEPAKRSAYAYGKVNRATSLSGRTKFGDPFGNWN